MKTTMILILLAMISTASAKQIRRLDPNIGPDELAHINGYRLSPLSPYWHAGSDSTDPGIDVDALVLALTTPHAPTLITIDSPRDGDVVSGLIEIKAFVSGTDVPASGASVSGPGISIDPLGAHK